MKYVNVYDNESMSNKFDSVDSAIAGVPAHRWGNVSTMSIIELDKYFTPGQVIRVDGVGNIVFTPGEGFFA